MPRKGGENTVSKTFLKYDKPLITAMIQCSTAEEAHDILYRGENVGKVVLVVKGK